MVRTLAQNSLPSLMNRLSGRITFYSTVGPQVAAQSSQVRYRGLCRSDGVPTRRVDVLQIRTCLRKTVTRRCEQRGPAGADLSPAAPVAAAIEGWPVLVRED